MKKEIVKLELPIAGKVSIHETITDNRKEVSIMLDEPTLFKKGDVLTQQGKIDMFIAGEDVANTVIYEDSTIHAIAGMFGGEVYVDTDYWALFPDVRLATEEEKLDFFTELKNQKGKIWNPVTMELEDELKKGDAVICWCYYKSLAKVEFFRGMTKHLPTYPYLTSGGFMTNALKWDGTEEMLIKIREAGVKDEESLCNK